MAHRVGVEAIERSDGFLLSAVGQTTLIENMKWAKPIGMTTAHKLTLLRQASANIAQKSIQETLKA